MPTENLAVTPDVAWTLGTGGSRASVVALPDDDVTSYITDSMNVVTVLTVADPVVLQSGNAIVSIELIFRARASFGGTQFYYEVSPDNFSSVNSGTVDVTGTWQTFTITQTTRPAGGAWTYADILALKAKLQGQAEASTWQVTTCYVKVNFESGAPQRMTMGVGK